MKSNLKKHIIGVNDEVLKVLILLNGKYSASGYISNEDELVMTLFYLRHYLSEQINLFLFDVSSSTFYQIKNRVIRRLAYELKDQITIDDGKRREKSSEYLGVKVTVLVDGSEQEIYESSSKDVENASFSTKRVNTHLIFLFAVLLKDVFYMWDLHLMLGKLITI